MEDHNENHTDNTSTQLNNENPPSASPTGAEHTEAHTEGTPITSLAEDDTPSPSAQSPLPPTNVEVLDFLGFPPTHARKATASVPTPRPSPGITKDTQPSITEKILHVKDLAAVLPAESLKAASRENVGRLDTILLAAEMWIRELEERIKDLAERGRLDGKTVRALQWEVEEIKREAVERRKRVQKLNKWVELLGGGGEANHKLMSWVETLDGEKGGLVGNIEHLDREMKEGKEENGALRKEVRGRRNEERIEGLVEEVQRLTEANEGLKFELNGELTEEGVEQWVAVLQMEAEEGAVERDVLRAEVERLVMENGRLKKEAASKDNKGDVDGEEERAALMEDSQAMREELRGMM